ncbi:hypothetical protein GQ457_02G002220 [Hibiscus cannabinus]
MAIKLYQLMLTLRFPRIKTGLYGTSNRWIITQGSGLYGEAVGFQRFNSVNTSWFQAALHIHGDILLSKTGGTDEQWCRSIVGILGRAVVSLGVPVKRLIHLFSGLDLYGGSLTLTTMDGKLLVDGIPNTKFISVNSSIFLQLMNPNGAQNVSCTAPETYILSTVPSQVTGSHCPENRS